MIFNFPYMLSKIVAYFSYSIVSYSIFPDVVPERNSLFLYGACHWSVVQRWSNWGLEIRVPSNER